jgi:hypothetical protein
VLQSLVYLALATGAGLALIVAPEADWALAVALAYGVFGLVGFLAQIVIGMESRLLPLVAWLWSFAGGGYRETPPSLYRTPLPSLQRAGLALWTAAVPLLAAGLARDHERATRAGAGLLLLAVVGNAVNAGIVLARSRRRTGQA